MEIPGEFASIGFKLKQTGSYFLKSKKNLFAGVLLPDEEPAGGGLGPVHGVLNYLDCTLPHDPGRVRGMYTSTPQT